MIQPDRASLNEANYAEANYAEANYALTVSQRAQLDADLTEIRNRAEEISNLIAASFGRNTDVAIRAGEVDAALQRLQWCLERERAAKANAGSTTAPTVLSMRSQSEPPALAARH